MRLFLTNIRSGDFRLSFFRSFTLRIGMLWRLGRFSRSVPSAISLILMEALQERDAVAARQAMQDDIFEGGALLVRLPSKIESGEAVVNEGADGNMRLDLGRE
jgi:hypothetical protein